LQGDYAEAQHLYEESMTLRRGMGDKRGIAAALAALANVRIKLGDYATAQTLLDESLTLFRQLGNRRGIVNIISALAYMRQMQGQLYLATQMFGAVDALLIDPNIGLDELNYLDQKGSIALLRSQLVEASFNAAWEKGRSLTLEQAIALAGQSKLTPHAIQ
jgi:tetratricopeptide (TPR) repeat protein